MATYFARYIHEGDVWDDVAPSVDVKAATPYEISSGYWGVPSNDVTANVEDVFRVSGIFDGVKASAADAVAVGTMMAWNGSTGFTIDADGDWRAAKPSSSGDPRVLLVINASTSGGGSGSIDAAWTEDRGVWDATQAIPSVDVRGAFYHVNKPTTNQTKDFGSGNEIIRSRGKIWSDGTRWFWEPFNKPIGSTVANKAALITQGVDPNEGFIAQLSNSKMRYRFLGGDETVAGNWQPILTSYSVSKADSITIRSLADSELETGHILSEYDTGKRYGYFQDLAADPPDTEAAWHELSGDAGTGTGGETPGVVTATTDGLKRKTGWITVANGTTIPVGDGLQYLLGSGAYDRMTGLTAAHDGLTFKFKLPPGSSMLLATGAGENFQLLPNWGSAIDPTNFVIVNLVYEYASAMLIEHTPRSRH